MVERSQAEIERFVVEFFVAIGGLVEFTDYKLAEVVLPDDYVRDFPTRQGFLRLAFDPEVAREHPDAELVTYGSPFLDALLDRCTRTGLVTARCVMGVRVDQPRLRVFERVDRTLTFLNCKRPVLESVTPIIATYLQFDFKVTLTADEKEEELLPIVVNANARQADTDAIVGLRSAVLGETLDLMAPVEPICGMEDAYALACQEAERHARAAAERHASRARFALLKELGRLHAFFDRNRADWEKQLTRLSASGTAPPERVQAWEDRLRINEIERERRIQDIREKYRLSLHLQLVGAMRLLQPKVQVMIRVTDRKVERSVPVYYDPLLHRVEPLVCGGCGQWASRVTLVRDGRLLCEQCTAS